MVKTHKCILSTNLQRLHRWNRVHAISGCEKCVSCWPLSSVLRGKTDVHIFYWPQEAKHVHTHTLLWRVNSLCTSHERQTSRMPYSRLNTEACGWQLHGTGGGSNTCVCTTCTNLKEENSCMHTLLPPTSGGGREEHIFTHHSHWPWSGKLYVLYSHELGVGARHREENNICSCHFCWPHGNNIHRQRENLALNM